MSTEISTTPIKTSDEKPSDLRPLPDQGDLLIAAAQTPKYLGIQRQTLARWRCEGFGPPWIAVGRRIFYRSSDLKDWLDSRKRHNTIRVESNHGAAA